jgi:hypothetical protein
MIESSAHAENWSVNVNGISIRTDKNNLSVYTEYWNPVCYHNDLGFEIDFKVKKMPFNILFESLKSSVSGQFDFIDYKSYNQDNTLLNMHVDSKEYSFGLRKIWEFPFSLRPFLGGGFSKIYTKGTAIEDYSHGSRAYIDDSELGMWLDTGLYSSIINHFNFGIEYKISSARNYRFLDILPYKNHARSQYRLLFGIHF